MVSLRALQQAEEAKRRAERVELARRHASQLGVRSARSYTMQKAQQDIFVKEDVRRKWKMEKEKKAAEVDKIVFESQEKQGEGMRNAEQFTKMFDTMANEEVQAWEAERALERERHNCAVTQRRLESKRVQEEREALLLRKKKVKETEAERSLRIRTAVNTTAMINDENAEHVSFLTGQKKRRSVPSQQHVSVCDASSVNSRANEAATKFAEKRREEVARKQEAVERERSLAEKRAGKILADKRMLEERQRMEAEQERLLKQSVVDNAMRAHRPVATFDFQEQEARRSQHALSQSRSIFEQTFLRGAWETSEVEKFHIAPREQNETTFANFLHQNISTIHQRTVGDGKEENATHSSTDWISTNRGGEGEEEDGSDAEDHDSMTKEEEGSATKRRNKRRNVVGGIRLHATALCTRRIVAAATGQEEDEDDHPEEPLSTPPIPTPRPSPPQPDDDDVLEEEHNDNVNSAPAGAGKDNRGRSAGDSLQQQLYDSYQHASQDEDDNSTVMPPSTEQEEEEDTATQTEQTSSSSVSLFTRNTKFLSDLTALQHRLQSAGVAARTVNSEVTSLLDNSKRKVAPTYSSSSSSTTVTDDETSEDEEEEAGVRRKAGEGGDNHHHRIDGAAMLLASSSTDTSISVSSMSEHENENAEDEGKRATTAHYYAADNFPTAAPVSSTMSSSSVRSHRMMTAEQLRSALRNMSLGNFKRPERQQPTRHENDSMDTSTDVSMLSSQQ